MQGITREEALALLAPERREELRARAHETTEQCAEKRFDFFVFNSIYIFLLIAIPGNAYTDGNGFTAEGICGRKNMCKFKS